MCATREQIAGDVWRRAGWVSRIPDDGSRREFGVVPFDQLVARGVKRKVGAVCLIEGWPGMIYDERM